MAQAGQIRLVWYQDPLQVFAQHLHEKFLEGYVSSFRIQSSPVNKQYLSFGACWRLFLKAFIGLKILRYVMATVWPIPLRIHVELLL